MRFSDHVLLLQLATVSAVVMACAGVFLALTVQQLQHDAENSALAIARTVSEDADVRAAVAEYSSSPRDPTNAQIRTGPLQVLATSVRERTDALFVVITDDHGLRLTHPEPALLGAPVSTSFDDALHGRETVSWATGTLGESARAKVPVLAPGSTTPVGEVSVGFARASVFSDLPPLLVGVVVTALLAVGIGTIASLLIRRRLTRLTLGLQPEELSALVQDQAAVLDGVGEGVVAFTNSLDVSVCNRRAERMLGLDHPVGKRLGELHLPAPLEDRLVAAVSGHEDLSENLSPEGSFVVNGRIVYLEVHRVQQDGQDLGAVAVLRDRTDLVSLTRRLDAVATMTNALRAQRHEFANRLHVVGSLIDAGRVRDARTYLSEVVSRGPLKFPVDHADRVQEPYLQALIGAKGIEAAERGVLLGLGAETLILGTVGEPEDVATVLGNLVDNAVRAAVEGDEPKWVEVELLDEGDTLFVTVSDSGAGVSDPDSLFARTRESAARPDDARIHGHGFGLPLCRDIARRRDGDVWLIDAGSDGANGAPPHGAVLCARLPGTMSRASASTIGGRDR